MPNIHVNSGSLNLCYILLCVVENFFVSYVRIVLENAGFVWWYIDKSILLKKSYIILPFTQKAHGHKILPKSIVSA